MTELLAHSPLGASGAHRWMVCPGSVSLGQGLYDEESEFAALGTKAHELAAYCVQRGKQAWEAWDAVFPGETFDRDMGNAVEVYYQHVNDLPDANRFFIEDRFHCPSIHELFYGTVDYGQIEHDTLRVRDYKHGAGIVVEAENNPQLMYYAAGILEEHDLWDTIDTVDMGIVQPRGFHWLGPIRTWEIATNELRLWVDNVLVPAMDRAMVSGETSSGSHCRFCPVRSYACPQLMADMEELENLMEKADKKGVAHLSEKDLGRILTLAENMKIFSKAASETAFARAQKGAEIPGWKLAKARSFREWREGAEEAAKEKFKRKAMEPPKFKSPAQVDALPGGKTFTAEWAFKPDKGLTLVPEADTRKKSNQRDKPRFAPLKEKE